MMPPPNNNPPPPQDQETRTQNQKTNSERPAAPEQGIKCPRCESPNTKFCYYNNYSLTQPRHFCKTCRRYWTNGGALRNVPIGGGCRKNKRPKSSSSSSSSSSSRSLSCDPKDFQLHGITIPPSLDFSLSGLSYPSPITTGVFNFNQLSSFANVTVPATNALSSFQLDPTAASNPMVGLAPPNTEFWSLGQSQSSTLSDPLNIAMQGMNVHGNLTSSIETLSNMNQELHMNMQQQRLAMMFGGPSQNGDGGDGVSVSKPAVMHGFENNRKVPQQQPILFHQNLEISNSENMPGGSSVREGPASGGDTVTSTEWFFGNPYSAVSTAATTSNHGNNVNVNGVNNNWGNVSLAWGDLQHQPFTVLP